MAQSAVVDDKGRILLPKEARRKAGIRPRSRLLVEVEGSGVIKLKDYEALTRRVQKVAAKKLHGWKEEEHKEAELLFKIAAKESKKFAAD